MTDLLLPTTDAGVAVQWAIAAAFYPPLIWVARRNREIMIFCIGLAVMTVALLGLRAIH